MSYMYVCVLVLVWMWEVGAGLVTDVVKLQQGRLRGSRSLAGYNRYYSIPYATSHRFKPPTEPPKWEGVYDAINPLIECNQFFFFSYGTEDCLYLDVYTRSRVKPTDKWPVMIFFHGGAYYYGGKTLYNPEYLVEKNVIVVIINYRLSVFGFLCVNGVANLGLKDQRAAMKWVQTNIAAFGGDPDNVSLCGQSAGASSIAMHMMSKSSKGLFHKAILISGTSLQPWAFNIDPFSPALSDARKLGPANTEQDIYNIFLKAPAKLLAKTTQDVSANPKYFKYSPCVDTNTTDPFFHDTPYNIIKSGSFYQVPLIIGYTDAEGIIFYGLMDRDIVEVFNKNFVDTIPVLFSWCSEEDRKMIAQMIRTHYFGNEEITRGSEKNLVTMYSDWIGYSTVHAFSDIMSRVSRQPVYNYQLSYEGDRNIVKAIAGTTLRGASHSDELFYLFKPLGITLPLSKRDSLFINRVTTMFANFMKYGNPTPARTPLLPVIWPPATANSSNILQLDHTFSLTEVPRRLSGEFYNKLLCTYGQNGYVPCDSAMMCKPKS